MKDVYFFSRDTRLFAMSATENIALVYLRHN